MIGWQRDKNKRRVFGVFTERAVATLVMFATLFYSFGGLDLYLGYKTPFAPRQVDASYTGKHLKTIEYILGGGTDGNSQATAVTEYFGNGTSTVKATAGTKSIVIAGTNIVVKNAYLDVSYQVATAASVTHEAVTFDVGNSSSAGTSVDVEQEIATNPFVTSSLTGYQRRMHDVTGFFSQETDSNWSAGVPVEAGVTVTGPTRALTTVKLVITYESDYSLIPHTETKTVRFPLHSLASGDRGTRQTACAITTTCSFAATSTIPDAAADGDILDVYVEMHGEVDSGTASNFKMGIRGGSGANATSSPMQWIDVLADHNTVTGVWRPTVGSPNFQRNTTMIIDVLNGAVAMNALGGELVVTYRYSTGSTAQTETVRYYLNQDTTSSFTALHNFTTITPTISNGTLVMQDVWFRVHAPATTTATLTISGAVGTSSTVSNAYALTGTNPRTGADQAIFFDLSDKAANFFAPTTTISGSSQWSAGGVPVAAEVEFTFTWNGSLGGAQTQTVSFSGAQQGTNLIASVWNDAPAYIDLPETVTKTYRSAYLETQYMHSSAAAITMGTVTIGANGSTTVLTEYSGEASARAYTPTIYIPIASTTFSNGNTISWTRRALEINETKSVANVMGFTNQVVVTYDADFTQSQTIPTTKHLKTIEYILGGGTDGNSQATAVTEYFGNGTSTVKATAGTKSIVIAGTNIVVKNAYLDVSYQVATAASVTHEAVTFDVGNSSSAGTSVDVEQEIATNPFVTSSLTGYQRRMHDVTGFFSQETDSNWSAGVPVEAGVTVTGPTRALTTVKLVITYESDYSLIPHTETKTVRFPLHSLASGDRGTRQTACAITTTCSFAATSTIPDAAADGDILDVYVEMHGEVDSGTASNFKMGIRGGSGANATSSPMQWIDVLADHNTVTGVWRPTVGSPNFQRNTTMIIDVLNGAVAMNALGGELVVTYRYSTGSTAQTETVRYYLNQDTTSSFTALHNFTTITPTISNGTLVMQDVWFRVHAPATTTATLTISGAVGTSSTVSNAYALTGTNPRTGADQAIFFDLSDKAANFFAPTTTISGSSQWSAGGVPVAAEVEFTFTWNGSLGGAQTQTVSFSGAQQGTNLIASVWNDAPAYIDLPETVTKTYRSAYLETQYMHSSAAAITMGTVTIGANGSTTVLTEYSGEASARAYTPTIYIPIASTTFSNGNTISWTRRALEINETKSVANVMGFTNQVVVTYDANQAYKFPTFTQNYYRFYVDNGAVKPTTAWPSGSGGTLGENTEITSADSPPLNGSNLRLRMSLTVATTTMLASSTQFKLQYAPRAASCGAVLAQSWSDVGIVGSTTAPWRGFNATPADGTNLSTNPPTGGDLLLSVSSRAGLYTESNPTLANPFPVAIGEDVEYDWNIQNNNAATDTPYCFRMVKSDGTVFDNYTQYPTAMTGGYTAQTDAWQWFDDETNETPTSPLAGVNVAPANVVNGNIIKLRISVKEVGGSNGVNQKFKVQYSEWSDFSQYVFDVTSTSTCKSNSLWCYGDGVDNDNDAITTRIFSSTTAKGTHNEGTTTTTFGPLASTATEFEYTLKHAGARANTTYYFRLWDLNHNRPVATSTLTGSTYPSLSTQGATVSFSITGSATSSVVAGVTTDVATTPTSVPFYTIPIGSTGVKAAYHLSISTDATNGYQVFMKSNSDLTNPYGASIPNITGTNAAPTAWATGCSGGAAGCYGYHTTDATLSNGSTRFLIDDTYAAFSSTTADEVMYNSGPVTNDTADILYRVEAHAGLTGGGYTTNVQYIVVPIF